MDEKKLQKQLEVIGNCLTTINNNAGGRRADDINETNEQVEELTRVLESIYYFLFILLEDLTIKGEKHDS